MSEAMTQNVTTDSNGFLAFVAEDVKQSPKLYLTGLALLLSVVFLQKLSSPGLDEREPPLLKPGIPVIGHLIGMMKHHGGYFQILFDKTRARIGTLPILGGKLYIIFEPAMVQSAYRNKNLAFEPFAVEFAQRELAISNESARIVRETNLVPDFFSVITKSMAGEYTHQMNANALKYVSKELKTLGSSEPSRIPNLYLWVRDMMTIATTEALYGPDNPIKGNPSLLEDLWTFEAGLTGILLNVFPSITARAAHYARARLQAALGKYYGAKKDQHEDAAQIVKSRATVLRNYGILGAEVGNFELALLHVSTANTIPTLFWFMAQIYTRPELVSRLREEVVPVAQHSDDNEVIIDITTLDQKCPLLVSCYREAIRLSNQTVGNRRVMEDTTISDGKGNSYLLKKGLNVQMSAQVLHTMHSVWGNDVMEFDPERFIEKGGKENLQSDRAKRTSFAPFGGGRHLCPGRNFAFAENLGLMTSLLLGFDVSPLDQDYTAFKVPSMKACVFSEAAGKPENEGQGFGVQIQKKKGWEKTQWRFVS